MTEDLHENSHRDFITAIANDISQTTTMSANTRFYALTMNRAELSQMYLEHGIVQTLINQPIEDAFRGGIDIICPELSADDIEDLQNYIARNNIIHTYCQGLKWARLFGGAGIIINIGQDMTKPFRVASITEKTKLEFYPVDRWELSYTPTGSSLLDQFQDDKIDAPYNYYGHVVHRDNVIRLCNNLAPSMIRGQFSGWGVSEIEKIVREYNLYLKHQSVTFEILDESKIDVFKIESFNSQISTPGGALKTARRIREAAQMKNFQNALVIDKNDDYEQKQIAFGGVAEILNELRIGLACALRMPMTKLFGLSAAGFSTGEEDAQNYNCMIESEIRSKSKDGLILILGIICQKVLGYIPENIEFDYKPLRILSATEESAIKTSALERIVSAVNAGLLPHEKAVELINHEKIFGIDLDPNDAIEMQDMKEMGMKDEEEAA